MARDTQVRTYDPKQVVIVFGAVIFTGFAEGSFITITRSGDLFEKKKGSDGSVNRTNKNSFDFSVNATLQQTSITNDALSLIVQQDILSNNGIKPLTVKDLSGTTLFFAEQAWIKKDPDDEEADVAGSREWQFDTGYADKFTGGNL